MRAGTNRLKNLERQTDRQTENTEKERQKMKQEKKEDDQPQKLEARAKFFVGS